MVDIIDIDVVHNIVDDVVLNDVDVVLDDLQPPGHRQGVTPPSLEQSSRKSAGSTDPRTTVGGEPAGTEGSPAAANKASFSGR